MTVSLKEIVYLSNQIQPPLFQSQDWDTIWRPILACYPLSETKALKGVLMVYANGLGMLCVNLEAGGRPNRIGRTICKCVAYCAKRPWDLFTLFFYLCERVPLTLWVYMFVHLPL